MSAISETRQDQKLAKYVFLIEDSEPMRQSLVGMLEFLGYQVQSFSSAVDFLQVPIQVGPAVVITDMCMPDMTGVELQAELLKRGRQIPIIFISGESTVQQSIDAMKQGAMEFLIKPFERDQLLAAVAKGLARDASYMRGHIERSALEENLKKLSARQLETFELLSQGLNNAELMERLNVSLATAKQYKFEVMRKLRLRSSAQLIALWASRSK
jgi:two-component system, LuxR family, response regulator FixJ